MKQSVFAILVLVAASAVLVSCGSNYNSHHPGPPLANPATIKVHVFVSNPLFPNGTSTAPVLNVVDGQLDLISPSVISVGATSPNARHDGAFSQQEIYSGLSAPTNNTLSRGQQRDPKRGRQTPPGIDYFHYAAGFYRKYRGGAGQRHRLCRRAHCASDPGYGAASRRGRSAGSVQ